MKIAIVTDSNSGIFERQARKMGVHVVSMPFSINGEWLYEGVQLTAPDFYKAQAAGAEITTSMPSPADVTGLWEKLLADHDELVYIPMTSGLSGSCAAASALAQDYDGRVQVVDNKRISLTQLQSVLDAKRLVKRGLTAAQVKAQLEQHALDSSIYITCSDLKYLKKGGRITPAAAAIGTVLNIKPVLQIQGEKIDAYAKVRGMHQAVEKMLDAICDDITGRVRTYEAIVKGHNVPKPGVPESFKVLVKELQSLCLDIKVLDKDGQEIELKDDDDEMTTFNLSRMDADREREEYVADETDFEESGFGIEDVVEDDLAGDDGGDDF